MSAKTQTAITAIRKKDYNVVIQPDGIPRQRFLISIHQLPTYIGAKRSNFIMRKILAMKEQNKRFRVQNFGLVDVYVR